MNNLKLNIRNDKISIIDIIELGLNLIAQDVFWKHTEEDIDNYVNRFKFYKEKIGN